MRNPPPTEPQPDKDGRIWADSGPIHYLVHILEDGSEWRQLTSNAAWSINSAAKRRSMRKWQPKDGYVVRADTHEAIYYYKAGEGYQPGWRENDPNKAKQRKDAYERGDSIIRPCY